MPKYHFLSTRSLATGVTAVSVHSFRRCTLQPHGDSWLYFPSVTHCSQGHEVLLAMILIGEGCHCMDGHCLCKSCDFPKAINSRLHLEAGSLWHKVKETELADWWCCVHERKSTVSWIVSFCCLTASSAMCFTEPPTPSQEPFAMTALK